MWMYDLTGGFRIGKLHKRLKADAAFAHLPTMPRDRLAGGYLYYDATTDDARLVLTSPAPPPPTAPPSPTAAGSSPSPRTPPARSTGPPSTPAAGAFDVRARVVVNAAGVWADEVRALEDGVDPDSIRPAKGVHLTVPWAKVRNDIAAVIPVRGDKRSLFVVPWGRQRRRHVPTHLRRHDRHRLRRPARRPAVHGRRHRLRARRAERRRHHRRHAPTTSPACGPACARSSSRRPAGARPTCPAATASRSARPASSAITGGKLTTYREMAEDTVDAVLARLGRKARCRTKRLRLLGADGFTRGAARARRPPTSPTATARWRRQIDALVAADPTLGEPLVPGLPYLRAEAVYAARHEMATTLDDVLAAAHPGPPLRPPGHARGRRRRSPSCSPASSAGTTPRRARQLAAYRDARRRRGGRRHADRGRPMTEPTPPIELTGTAARWPGAVDVPAAVARRAGARSAPSSTTSRRSPSAAATGGRSPCTGRWPARCPAARRGGRAARRSTEQVAAVVRVCADAQRPAHRRRRPQRRVPARRCRCSAASLLDITGLRRHRRGRRDVGRRRGRSPARSGPTSSAELQARHGLSVGHFPQSFDLATVGGWVACRGAGQYSTRYGKIEDLVVGLEVVLADGTVVRTGGAPAAAVGPDLTQLFVGSEGTLGVVTRVWLRAHPRAAGRAPGGLPLRRRSPTGIEACRQILRRGATPAVLRLYDEVESARGHGGDGTRCALLVLDEGDPAIVDATMAVVADVLRRRRRRRRRRDARRRLARPPQRHVAPCRR